MTPTVSVGIMVYNEETTIGRLLDALLRQEVVCAFLKEIMVVASGCTDSTVEIVTAYVKRDERVKLIIQEARKGKASAVNLFLSQASGEIIVLESGDTIPLPGTFDKLLRPFEDPSVGMTGAHPLPINRKDTFMGYVVNLMWELHHKIALYYPKMGELVAFRNFVRVIPEDTPVDEASIEAIVAKKGYRICYVPEAIVRNKAPETVRDFLCQRRRIATGHKYVRATQKFQVHTDPPLRILRVLLSEHSWGLRDTVWTAGAIGLEAFARMLGNYDYYLGKKKHTVWDIAPTTKNWNEG